jgi:hypothetical protein
MPILVVSVQDCNSVNASGEWQSPQRPSAGGPPGPRRPDWSVREVGGNKRLPFTQKTSEVWREALETSGVFSFYPVQFFNISRTERFISSVKSAMNLGSRSPARRSLHWRYQPGEQRSALPPAPSSGGVGQEEQDKLIQNNTNLCYFSFYYLLRYFSFLCNI